MSATAPLAPRPGPIYDGGMKTLTRRCLTLVLATLAVTATAPALAAGKPRELSWEDLLPPPGSPLPPQPQAPSGIPGKDGVVAAPGPALSPLFPYNPNPALDGQLVKLPGYIVPLDSDEGGLIQEFLLVPYFGACIHVPPPPPNQIVFVKLAKPYNLKSMADPVWITGTMKTQAWSGDVADTDYVMTGEKVEKFDWKQ
jgi:hypothetical protein